MKTGAPIKEVKIPIGISDGATNVLLIVSATMTNIAPKNAERGKIIT